MNTNNNTFDKNTSPIQHFAYINNIYKQHKAPLSAGETSADNPPSYAWGGELEERRLQLQNGFDGGFGYAHLKYHEKLKADGFDPRIIIELGTGADALLMQHLLAIYTNLQQIYVIELDPQKVEKAKATLQKKVTDPEKRKKVIFIIGDVAQELPKLPKADLIDIQLLLTHLPTHPPLLWDAEKQGEYPTLQRVLNAILASLTDKGLAVVGDLATDDFDVSEGAGFDGSEKTQKLIQDAKLFLKGDDTFRGILNIGFNDRGAHAFKDREHIIEIIEKYSDNTLHADKDSTQIVRIENISNHDDIRAAVAAYIAPTVAFQSEIALNNFKKVLANSPHSPKAEQIKQLISKMEPTVKELWRLGERYVQSLQWDENDPNRKKDDTVATLPSMVHISFRKA